jgi:hypothetical protein
VNFFKRLLKGGSEPQESAPPAVRPGPPSGSSLADAEPFDYEVRIVHLPPGGAPRVWKTRTVKADPSAIYLLPPHGWEETMPQSEPLSLYVMTESKSSEFDSIVRPHRVGDEVLLRVDRPPELTWKSKDGGSAGQQKRKFLRIDVSLPALVSEVIPTLSGSALRVDEGHEARMIDLSMEGASLLSNWDAPADRLVEIKVLGPVFPLTAQARVVRVRPSPQPSFRFNIACAFQNTNQVTRDMIGQYILDRQKEKK